eukprot:GDKH01006119.1.p1 GENE.GDKH01006119.1~~GDKH01006119.1.p1  ORF type:complete len:201 (-),score=52.89 GDKH01006119.1:225-827(-)
MLRSLTRCNAAIPDCIAAFGAVDAKICFISHPGVLAVSRLLELRKVVKYRANFTQENIDMIREFDDELADKAQIAFDNNLKINMIDLEYIQKPGYLGRLLEEQRLLGEAAKEVLSAAPGKYEVPTCVKNGSYKRPELAYEERKDVMYKVADQLFRQGIVEFGKEDLQKIEAAEGKAALPDAGKKVEGEAPKAIGTDAKKA